MVLRPKHWTTFCAVLIVAVLACWPSRATAQKFKVNEADAKTKQWHLETFPIVLKADGNTKMDAVLRAVDTSFFLMLSGSGVGTNTIDKGSKLIFLLENDSTVTVRSVAIQSMDFTTATPTYQHEYKMSADDLDLLNRYSLQALRKYSAGGYDDIEIDKSHSDKMKQQCNLFTGEWTVANKSSIKPIIIPPHFPGGNDAFARFLVRNFTPTTSLPAGEKKELVVQFSIAENGVVDVPEIKQSAGAEIDTELLRIFRRMPNWKPAAAQAKQVEYKLTQQIVLQRTGALVSIQVQ